LFGHLYMIYSYRTIYQALLLVFLLLLLTSFGIQAHIYSFSESFNDPIINLLQSKTDTNQVKLLLQLGNPMADTSNKAQPHVATTLLYAQQAKFFSDSLHYTKGQILANYYLAYIYSQKGENQQAQDFLLEGIKISKERGYNRQGADGWYTLRDTYRVSQQQLTEVISWYGQAMMVSQKIGNKQIEADILKEIAFLHHQQGKHALGATELKKVLAIYDSINNPKLHYVYDLLSAINQSLGNYSQALKCSLATIESAHKTRDTTHIANFYIRLGMIYRDLKKPEDGLICFKSALRHAQRAKQKLMAFNALSLVSSTLILLGKKEESLALVLKNIKVNPPEDEASRILVSEILANCYLALKQYLLAEKYIIEMLSYQEKRPQNDQYKMIVMEKTGRLYLEMKAYAKSKFYLQKAMLLNQQLRSPQNAILQQLLIFKLDSAQGRFEEAISHYQQYKALNDSIYNEAKSKEIARLEVQYESEKKRKDLLLKEHNIKALTRENLLQEEKMRQDQLIRNVIIGGSFLLLLLSGVIYNRYRLKRRSNQLLEAQQKVLQAQQKVIHEKNEHLSQLLEEKEWLLKEIHHRVKNNLQIVMSLLDSQADFLQDGKALAAIQESQQRVYAISLIHQKLYQTENLALIEMDTYISEVVSYICESFDVQGRIQFLYLLLPLNWM
jgi:two-component sensor histidine kinase